MNSNMKLIIFILMLFSISLRAENAPQIFPSTSLIHTPTTEDIGRGNLDFIINHRFGNADKTHLAGFDNGASIMLGADYGISDRWSFGLSYASYGKTFEGRTKFNLFRSTGSRPFAVSFFGAAGQETTKQSYPLSPTLNIYNTGIPEIDAELNRKQNTYVLDESDKRSFMASLIFSSKLSDRFSMLVSPMYVHRNFVKSNISNDRNGLALGASVKLSRRTNFIFSTIVTQKRDYLGENYEEEDKKSYTDSKTSLKTLTADQINAMGINSTTLPYIYMRNVYYDKPVQYASIPVSMGVDITTAMHSFQIFISNSRDISSTWILRGAELDYKKKGWSVGFNIHRKFNFAIPDVTEYKGSCNDEVTFAELQESVKTVCTRCHAGQKPEAGFNITRYEDVKERTKGTDPAHSLIFKKITVGTMSERATPEIKKALYCWIKKGTMP